MTKQRVDKIARVLIQPCKELVVKIHCRLTKEVNGVVRSFHNFFSYNDGNYLNLDHYVYLTIEFKDDSEWSRDKVVIINTKNIHQLLSGLKFMINTCRCNDDIYVHSKLKDSIDVEDITIYPETIKENIWQVRLLGDDTPRILLHPSVKEENDVKYEALRIYINRKVNYVDMTLDEAEALYYTLQKVDFFQYGMSMIQYYISSIESEKIEIKDNSRKQIQFDTRVEKTESFIQRDKSAADFFDIK